MECLQVFDKEKNMLNEKISREDKLSLKDGKHFMIVIIFIENNGGKFLLQQTSSNRDSCIVTTGGHFQVNLIILIHLTIKMDF